MEKILTFCTPNHSANIRLTKRQMQALKKATLWPRDHGGALYGSIGKPFHLGQPTWSDAEIQSFIASRTHPSQPAVDR